MAGPESQPSIAESGRTQPADRAYGTDSLPVHALDRVSSILNNIPIVVGSLLLICLTVAVCSNVIARFFFNSSVIWSDEVARFSLIWVTFLGSAVLVRTWDHITVDVFVARMPNSVQDATYLLSNTLSTAIAFLLIWQGIDQVGRQSLQMSPALQLNMGMIYTVVPIAGLYMLAYSLNNMVRLRQRARAIRPGAESLEL